MQSRDVQLAGEVVADSTATLLQQLGGQAGLDALVGAFYFNVLNDDRVAHFFAGADVDAVRYHQRRFLATALGGPNQYRGRSLRDAHRHLVEEHGLNGSHFDAIIEILATTLDDFGHRGALAQTVVARVAAMGDDVLGTG